MVLELHAKIYEKITKIRLYDKRYKFETKQSIWFKIWYDNFKTGILILLKFQIRPFQTDWKKMYKD